MAQSKQTQSENPKRPYVLVREAEEQKPVNPTKWYTVAIQLGARQRWRTYNGGRWTRDPENDRENMKAYKHVAAVHKVGPLSGEEVNGLIARTNKFLRANREQRLPDGDISRMFLVTAVTESKPPQARRMPMPFDMEEVISKVAESAAVAAVTALMKK